MVQRGRLDTTFTDELPRTGGETIFTWELFSGLAVSSPALQRATGFFQLVSGE